MKQGNAHLYAKVKAFGSINNLSRSWSKREQRLSHTRVRQEASRVIRQSE
jgi:hypothetical protein